jgi:hypothetical protein
MFDSWTRLILSNTLEFIPLDPSHVGPMERGIIDGNIVKLIFLTLDKFRPII